MARRREHVSEADLGAIVVAYLEKLGADVYQEVEVLGGVADIVARVRAELWIVEVKATLRLSLIMQAMERRRLAHRVYVAAPYSRHQRGVAAICEEVGIGLLMLRGMDPHQDVYGSPRVLVEVESRRWNSRPVELAKKLQPEHKTHAKAGAIGAGGRWTPFRSTCEQLARLVTARPGIPLKEAISEIQHHYRSTASARSSIAHWIDRGKVPGVRLENARLFPTEER